MKLVRAVIVLAVAITAVGCTYVANRFSIAAENVSALRSLKASTVAVGPSDAAADVAKLEMHCAGTGFWVSPPDNLSFAEYVRRAHVDELRIAGLYADNSPIVLAGTIDRIELLGPPFGTTGEWYLILTVRSSNGKLATASERYSFRAYSFQSNACEAAARALAPALQNLMGKVIATPAFGA